MKCLTWNVEWAPQASTRWALISQQITAQRPDVVCYTEVIRDSVPEGYVIEASSDYGYPHAGDRRKVLLWSRQPWTDVDEVGHPSLPTGRFITGVTGGIRFVGVCIPWKDAHVKTGRKDRLPWQDHLTYCEGLGHVLARYAEQPVPVCVLGDYNQRFPRSKQPEHVAAALLNALPAGYAIITEGMKDGEGKQLIDHVSLSPMLSTSGMEVISNKSSDGTQLTDHVGVALNLHLQ